MSAPRKKLARKYVRKQLTAEESTGGKAPRKQLTAEERFEKALARRDKLRETLMDKGIIEAGSPVPVTHGYAPCLIAAADCGAHHPRMWS